MVGGLTGAAIGALGGGLASAGTGGAAMEKAVGNATSIGEARGYAKAMHDMLNKQDVAEGVMAKMSPDMRDKLVKTFRRGWLTRWLERRRG